MNKLKLHYVRQIAGGAVLHLYVSSEYLDKLFGLSKESGRRLEIRAKRRSLWMNPIHIPLLFWADPYMKKTGLACIVPENVVYDVLEKDGIAEINRWIDEHEEEWS